MASQPLQVDMYIISTLRMVHVLLAVNYLVSILKLCNIESVDVNSVTGHNSLIDLQGPFCHKD